VRLGWNLAAGIANSTWSAVIGLAVVPFYVKILGVEAFGLIGFFVALQAVFALLDVGLAPTINREVARANTEAERDQARDLLHTLAIFYWGAAVVIAVAIVAAAPVVSRYWLVSVHIPRGSLVSAVMLMGLIIGSRFPLALYLGALMGAQRIVTASAIEMVMVTLANAGAVAVLAFVSPTIQAFFICQAVVGVANVAAVRAAAWHALAGKERPRFDRAGLGRIWRFSAGMGLTALLGAVFLQSDKVVLSKIVSLEDLGRYTLAGLGARSLYLFMTPAFGVVYPRLSALIAAGQTAQVERLYTAGTRLLLAAVFPLAAFVFVFSTEIFTLWTGDPKLSASVHLVVGLLLFGTALNGAMHLPYALQLASGHSSLPAKINLALVVIFAPLLILLAANFGIVGGAAAWAILNLLYLFFGSWVTHRNVLPGVGMKWIIGDVGIPLVVAGVVTGAGGALVERLDLPIAPRLVLGVALALCAALVTVASNPRLLRDARRFNGRALGASGV
jgi:O-antigen/teichoic acid export membrane protein